MARSFSNAGVGACSLFLFSCVALLLGVSPGYAIRGLQTSSSEFATALAAAVQKDAHFSDFAGILTKSLNLQSISLNTSGQVTILLPENFFTTHYNFSALQPADTASVLSMHILEGKRSFASLKDLKNGALLTTRSSGETLQKRQFPKSSLTFSVKKDAQGPRYMNELRTSMVVPDLFIGKRVVVHGVSSLLTPSAFTGGPYSTIPF